MTYYPKLILDALTHVRYPGTGKDLVSSGMIEDDMRIEGKKVSFSVVFNKLNDPFANSVIKACEQAIKTYVDPEVEIEGNVFIKSKQHAPNIERPLSHVKHTIAVASGKGGVGKSTVSANLAMALAQMGYKVGLLDADIYGPSMPKMFNVEDARPTSIEKDGKTKILPIEVNGIKLLSIGFFVNPNEALVWRGGMASNAIKQLINDGEWGDLDYFVVDLPPGTSDIHLTLVQMLQLSGAIVVSTPQQVALADARKGLQMFEVPSIKVPILGLIENMAWFTPAELPNNKYYIFGKDGCKRLAEEKKIALLGQIPLVQAVCESGDQGRPIVMDDGELSKAFKAVALNVVKEVEKL